MNMNKDLCEKVIEIDRLLKNIYEEMEKITKVNDRTWDQLVWMSKGYLDRQWEIIANENGKSYSSDNGTFIDNESISFDISNN